MSFFSSKMQWSRSIIFPRIFFFNFFNNHLTDIQVTNSCSMVQRCNPILIWRIFVSYAFKYQLAYFKVTVIIFLGFSTWCIMKRSGAMFVLWILVMNLALTHDEFIDFKSPSECSNMKWCIIPETTAFFMFVSYFSYKKFKQICFSNFCNSV